MSPTPNADRRSLLLLDGHSLAYRAFYALPDTLRTQTGQLTNAVYGFTSMLIKMLGDRRPDAIAVAFDKGRDVARTAAFPEYKANRVSAPDEFRPQVDLIKQVLEALQIPIVEVPGVEADDVLATIAGQAIERGFHAYVVTGDRDAMQLVDEHLTVLYTLRGITEMAEMTPPAVQERYGVPPSAYVDLAALRGDNSDNLPGVPGVGDKTAAKLVNQFGDIDGIYAHLDEVSGKKVPAMLAEHEQQVRTNQRIMRLRRDVECECDLADLRFGEIDTEAVRALFGSLEFRALYDRFVEEVLGEQEEAAAAAFDRSPQRLEAGGLRAWLDGAAQPLAVVPIVVDRPPHATPVAIAVAAPDRDPASARLDDLDPADLDALAAVLADPTVAKVTHDLKTLDHAAAALGWVVSGVTLDTELGAYLLNPEQRTFDLERLALQYLQRSIAPQEEADDADQLTLDVGEDDPWEERALRAEATFELARHLDDQLEQRGQRDLNATVELPLAPVLARMERAGITLDLHVLDEIRDRLAARVEELEREVHDHAGRPFNIGSGPQLQAVLFDELGLPKTRRIKTGYSTDAQALKNLAGQHPIIEAIGEWRETSKLLTTYVDALPPLVDPETGRIHTTLSQTIAATGRLSSSNPNLQNIPVRREEGREIRRAFVPGEGFGQLLVADYSQIELRIMAHLSQDDGLLDAFASGEDIHATTAAKVFDLPLEAVDGALRDRAKAVNYGLAYGLTPFGLGQQLGIPPSEAVEIVDAYMARFPKVRQFLDAAVDQARRDGFTTTLFGRRRYLPDLLSDNRNRRQMAERMALNAPIQGTAADVIKLAMITLQHALDRSGLRTQLLLQVHDEVILEVPEDEFDAARDLVVTELSGVVDLAVPLEVDTAFGPTWFDAQKH
ncbi:DNA polymerase I [Egicoccus halophilus]|uniref:DNA polymerase I n=1 Tax=Egicoccus halophilus TaxID=1670830 RepID=A0A8J3ACM5_9ACTN|nr:DNA polymerase I [Egicoccus halophilus]GGI04433.1 DNA polymerase [Egicoccus halophilus]